VPTDRPQPAVRVEAEPAAPIVPAPAPIAPAAQAPTVDAEPVERRRRDESPPPAATPRPRAPAVLPAAPPSPTQIVHVHEPAAPPAAENRGGVGRPSPAPAASAPPPRPAVSIEIGRIEIRTAPARPSAPPPRRVTRARPHVIDPGLRLGGRRW
jgi:protein TonB